MKSIIILILLSLSIFANDLNISKSYYSTYDNNLQVEALDNMTFLPLTDKKTNFGFTKKTYWIKVDVDPKIKENIYLSFNYTALDSIEVYKKYNNSYTYKKYGDLTAYNEQNLLTPNVAFDLNSSIKTVYIKVHTKGSMHLELNPYTNNQFFIHSNKKASIFWFYFGASLIMIFYNAFLYFMIRIKTYLLYVLFHSTFLVTQFTLNGFSNMILWPNNAYYNNFLIPAFISLSTLLAIEFTKAFLKVKDKLPNLYKLLDILMIATLISSLLVFILDYRYSVVISSYSSIFAIIIMMITSIVSLLKYKDVNSYFYVIAWSFLLGGVLILHLNNIGYLEANIFTQYSNLIGAFIELTLFSIALAYRYNTVRSEKDKLYYDHKQTVDKNKYLQKISNTDVLTEVFNRRYFFESSKLFLSLANRHKKPLSVLIIDIDHFKVINDTYGHDSGDLALKYICTKLNISLRKCDLFARIGGEEFAVLLPETNESIAVNIANKLINTIESSKVPINDFKKIDVTVSIGMHTYVDFDKDNVESIMKIADNNLYKAKNRGRNQVAYE